MTEKEKIEKLKIEFYKNTKLNEINGCLEWTGELNADGYGLFSLAGYRLTHLFRLTCFTHRISWVLNTGEPIPKYHVVRHLICNNRKCIKQEHLALGFTKDNNGDRKISNRINKPNEIVDLNPSNTKIKKIYRLYKVGVPDREIANKLNLSLKFVLDVIYGVIYKELMPNNFSLNIVKMSVEDIKEIFKLRFDGWTQDKIAEKFNITRRNISMILHRKIWKTVSISEEHLKKATFKQNADRKLNDEQVREIRKLKLEGYGDVFLARKFNVKNMTIYKICKNSTYKYVI